MNFDPALIPARLALLQARTDTFFLVAGATTLWLVDHRFREHFKPVTTNRIAVAYQARYHGRFVAASVITDASRSLEAQSAMAQDLLEVLDLVDFQWAALGVTSPTALSTPMIYVPSGP